MKFVMPAATTAERTSITPDAGELLYDEDLITTYFGDGTTAGGLLLAGIQSSSNLGAGEGLATAASGADLPFKSLVGGTNMTLSSDANEVTLDTTATINSTDSFLLARANHTGTQAQSTVTNTGGITDFWTGTQAAYDALTPDPNTIYFISG